MAVESGMYHGGGDAGGASGGAVGGTLEIDAIPVVAGSGVLNTTVLDTLKLYPRIGPV